MRKKLRDILITTGIILLATKSYADFTQNTQVLECNKRFAENPLISMSLCYDIYSNNIFSKDIRTILNNVKDSEVDTLKKEYQKAYEEREYILYNHKMTKEKKLEYLRPIQANMLVLENKIIEKLDKEIRQKEYKNFDVEMREAITSFLAKHPSLDKFYSKEEKERVEILQELEKVKYE